MKTKALLGITPCDLTLMNQSTVNAIIRDTRFTEEQAIKINNAKCRQRMHNYIYDNPQLFVAHFRDQKHYTRTVTFGALSCGICVTLNRTGILTKKIRGEKGEL